MSEDQSAKAGNIGDVFKHAILPELVLLWLRSEPTKVEPTYVETHAGFYTYKSSRLKKKGTDTWSGERAWSLRIVEESIHLGYLGIYGAALLSHLQKTKIYPGSLRLVEFATAFAENGPKIVGFDLGEKEVDSYPKSGRVAVRKDNGYEGIASVPSPRLIFCDPFWREAVKEDRAQSRELLLGNSPAIVWYPLKEENFRHWLKEHGIPHAELRFIHYKAPSPWSTWDLNGSGIAYYRLPRDLAAETVTRVGRRLKRVFRGQRHANRRLDLEFSFNPG